MLSAPIASWAASDGKMIHTDYVKYLKYELELWFAKASDNVVAARAIVGAINENSILDLAELLDHIGSEITTPSKFEVIKEGKSSGEVLQLAHHNRG